jgi:predicted Zn-ribbon and HTH transcriptional regulator
MNTQPTPETDELVRTQLERVGITSQVLASKLTLKCESLERERDEARAESIRWMSIAEGRGRTDDEDELAVVVKQRDRLAKACDQYSEDEILCKLQEITKQRDRLAKALRLIADGTSCRECGGEDQALFARQALQSMICEALQSLTPKP